VGLIDVPGVEGKATFGNCGVSRWIIICTWNADRFRCSMVMEVKGF